MSLRSRRAGSPSTSTTTQHGVHCDACKLGPATHTANKAEAESWAATHNQMRHRGTDTAEVKSS